MQKATLLLLIFFLWAKTKAQNVGVGTTNPQEKLHVAGNIKTDTIKPAAIKFILNAGNGKVLTSDADGNSNWQTLAIGSNGGAGFGAWGDCATNANVGGYNPVTHPDPSGSDQFGKTVSLSGNYAIIGAQSDDVDGNNNQGSASIFHFDGEQWVFMQLLTDPSGEADDLFGITVSISGNYAVVGAPLADIGANTDQGSANIFQFDGSNWVFVQQITDPAGEAGDNFGYSVSISGDLVVIGAYMDDNAFTDQGSASIFQYDGNSWNFVQQLFHPVPASNDLFGRSVSISGDLVIVGVYSDDIGINADQGSAIIFRYDGSSWNFQQQLADAVGTAGDSFGWSVAISGNSAIVGAYLDDNASVNQGSASVFRYDGSNWVVTDKLEDPNPVGNEQFGYHVSISGNYAIVGENKDITVGMNRGSATIYQRVGLGWQRILQVTDPGNRLNDEFGVSTALDAATRRFLIGAHGYRNNSGKAIFGKIN
jgi:hypothetical protein